MAVTSWTGIDRRITDPDTFQQISETVSHVKLNCYFRFLFVLFDYVLIIDTFVMLLFTQIQKLSFPFINSMRMRFYKWIHQHKSNKQCQNDAIISCFFLLFYFISWLFHSAFVAMSAVRFGNKQVTILFINFTLRIFFCGFCFCCFYSLVNKINKKISFHFRCLQLVDCHLAFYFLPVLSNDTQTVFNSKQKPEIKVLPQN